MVTFVVVMMTMIMVTGRVAAVMSVLRVGCILNVLSAILTMAHLVALFAVQLAKE